MKCKGKITRKNSPKKLEGVIFPKFGLRDVEKTALSGGEIFGQLSGKRGGESRGYRVEKSGVKGEKNEGGM